MAKAFRFRLEVVERVRRQAVDKQRRVVAEVLRDVAAAELRVARATEEIRALTLMTRDARQSSVLDVASLRGHQFHRGWLADQAIKAQAEFDQKKGDLAVERARLAENLTRLRVIEKLRERQTQAHRVEQTRIEQGELDEVALQQFWRRERVGAEMQAG
jgi:flagellar export protein FliJ